MIKNPSKHCLVLVNLCMSVSVEILDNTYRNELLIETVQPYMYFQDTTDTNSIPII